MLGQNINCEENRPMAPGDAWSPSYFFTVCLKLTKKTLALLLKVTETAPQTSCQMLIQNLQYKMLWLLLKMQINP